MMTRRTLLGALSAASLLRQPVRAQRGRLYDILIKGGEVIDPSRSFREIADLTVHDGKIAAVRQTRQNETNARRHRAQATRRCPQFWTEPQN